MRFLHFFSISIVLSIMLPSCKSSKLSGGITQYIIRLKSDKDLVHLTEAYAEYNITDIKRSSKSQFQYTATFKCNSNDCNTLEKDFASNEKILSYQRFKSKPDKVQTSKGSKSHRTGPIGSQGGQ